MNPPKIVILDGHALNPGDLSWDELRCLATVEIHERTPTAQVVDRCQGAKLVLTNKTPLSADAIQNLPDLRYIGVLATGYNIVDVEGARKAGIVVTNIPTYGTSSVAQFAFALLLELCHHVGLHSEAVRAGEWSRNPDWSFWKTPLVELAGKTMGIVGFGRIGRQTAAIAEAMGMRLMAHDPVVPATSALQDLLEHSDVISLHCPLTAENKGMIDRACLARMKPTAFLLNTSRGPLVVDQDLADALNAGTIAGAGLDVLSVEPPLDSNPLLKARNCIVTPHVAWATKEARQRLLDAAVANVRGYLEGRIQNAV